MTTPTKPTPVKGVFNRDYKYSTLLQDMPRRGCNCLEVVVLSVCMTLVTVVLSTIFLIWSLT